MKFLDADVKRLLVSVSATVDEGNIVVFGPQESYIENTSTGSRTTKNVRFDEPIDDADCCVLGSMRPCFCGAWPTP